MCRFVRDSVIRLAHRAAQRANGRFGEAALQRRSDRVDVAIDCLFHKQCPQTAYRVGFCAIQHSLQWAQSSLSLRYVRSSALRTKPTVHQEIMRAPRLCVFAQRFLISFCFLTPAYQPGFGVVFFNEVANLCVYFIDIF